MPVTRKGTGDKQNKAISAKLTHRAAMKRRH